MKNIDKISISDIRSLSEDVKIEAKGVDQEKLVELNNRLQYLDLLITISIDMRVQSTDVHIAGLDVLKLLPNIQRLKLNAVLTEPINEIKILESLLKLKELIILGYFKKNISLEPIEKLFNLEKIYIENGLSKNQQLIIEKFDSLSHLSVADLDLKTFPINEKVKELRIFRKLLYSSEVYRVFPNLENLDLENCKEIIDFSFINNFKEINALTFRYMKQLERFPNVHKLTKLKSISLINLSNLKDIDLLWENDNLTEFMATGIEYLKVEDFYGLKKFKLLKTVYITFKNVKENRKAQEFVLENNWEYRQPGI